MGILFDKYLIDMSKEEDSVAWLTNEEKGVRVSKFTPPFFPDARDEIGEIVMMHGQVPEKFQNKYYEVIYHEHLDTAETFFVTDGEMECITLGEKMVLHPGDIIHVPCYLGHSFRARTPYARLIVMFQTEYMNIAHAHQVYLREHHFEEASNPANAGKRAAEHHQIHRDNTYYYDTAPVATSSPTYRRFGYGIRSHTFPGIKLNLMVGRYETYGVKEVWEAEMKKGVRIENNAVRYDHRLFWIREGRVRFTIDGTEVEAYPNCLVYVPPYHCFDFEVLEDADIVDLSCPYQLQDLLEELRLILNKYPEKLKNDAVMNELFARFKADRVKYSFNG